MSTFLTNLKNHTALTASALCVMASGAAADVQHLDDVIITFSLCVGNDCVNGENFGFDTMRLKENNLRVHFDDTSGSASFPSNDWRITVNDTSNGGASYFGVEDASAGRIPFRVEAGAPANALYVESDGDVGIGTSNPVVSLHAVDGNTPTLRLEQDGSSGFIPQTYDIGTNESNFFIRDVTNGSQLPFRIQPGADSDSLYIANDNDIGMGTATPSASLHVRRTDGTAKLLVEDTNNTAASQIMAEFKNAGITTVRLTNTEGVEHSWNLQNRGSSDNNDFRITNGAATGASGAELTLSQSGDLTITGNITTTGTTCGTGCDRVFADDFELLSISAHADLMWQNSYLPNVGPTAEGAPFNLTDKLGRMLNELEHAHIYIAELHERIGILEEAVTVVK